MHRIIFFISLFTVELTFARGEWIKINAPFTLDLECMYVHDSSNVWIAGDSGTIGYSSDWGASWILQHSNDSYFIKDIHFIDSLNGWAVGLQTVPPFTQIYYTTDGGNNWTVSIFPDELIALRSIYFVDSLTGYLGGGSGSLYKTVDAGFKWTECNVDSFRLDINNIHFIDANNGLACGGIRDLTGVIWRSSDSGENWSAIPIPYEPVWELFILDSLNIIGIGGDLEYGTAIIRSSDGGYTWDYNSLSIFGVGTSIAFRNDSEVWGTLGSDLRLIYSADTGYIWISLPSPDSSALYDVLFADSLHGMAIGRNGAVYIYKEKITSVENNNYSIPADFNVYQNFPNPFNSSTNIIYNLPEPSEVSIMITDIIGRNIYSVIESGNEGRNTYKLNMQKFPSGIYFYSVMFKNYSFTGKMVYLR